MKKDKPIKIRKTWKINPRTRIKEDKENISSGCEKCGLYKTNPQMCTLENCPELEIGHA